MLHQPVAGLHPPSTPRPSTSGQDKQRFSSRYNSQEIWSATDPDREVTNLSSSATPPMWSTNTNPPHTSHSNPGSDGVAAEQAAKEDAEEQDTCRRPTPTKSNTSTICTIVLHVYMMLITPATHAHLPNLPIICPTYTGTSHACMSRPGGHQPVQFSHSPNVEYQHQSPPTHKKKVLTV